MRQGYLTVVEERPSDKAKDGKGGVERRVGI